MKESIRAELLEHIESKRADYNGHPSDFHNFAFNEDHYIIGYYNAEQWLISHDLSAWDAITDVREYKRDNFGEISNNVNSESIVNMLAYIYGEELINE